MDWLDKTLAGLFTLLVVLFIWLLSLAPYSLYAKAKCLSYGYPRYSVSVTYKAYCIRTINQTEFVVPLKDIK